MPDLGRDLFQKAFGYDQIIAEHAHSEWPDMVTELDRRNTHEIGFWPANRLLLESAGRGWCNAYAALATVNSWSGTLAPKGHPCVAYCVNGPASLRRRHASGNRHETRTVRPREFFVIPAHEETEWHRHGSSDMLMLYLRQDLINALARDHSSLAAMQADIDLDLGTVDPLLEQIALTLLDLLLSPEDGSSGMYADGLVQTMILHLLRRRNTPLTRRNASPSLGRGPRFRRVIDLIEADPGANLSIAVLASEAGLGERTFSRTFHERFGTTVHQYVLDKRVALAKRLLVSTNLPVVDVALQAGFSSQSHLATAFKRLTGLTPGQYRRC